MSRKVVLIYQFLSLSCLLQTEVVEMNIVTVNKGILHTKLILRFGNLVIIVISLHLLINNQILRGNLILLVLLKLIDRLEKLQEVRSVLKSLNKRVKNCLL